MSKINDQVQPGDIVEAWRDSWTMGQKVVGPAVAQGNALVVGDFVVGWLDGAELDADKVVTVISRAPRSLYVNHPRPEPVAGDVVRDADTDDRRVYMLADGESEPWIEGGDASTAYAWRRRNELPARLHLLVDGETGTVVPS